MFWLLSVPVSHPSGLAARTLSPRFPPEPAAPRRRGDSARGRAGGAGTRGRVPFEDHAAEDHVHDLPELLDVARGITADEHQIGPLPDGDLTEVGAVTRE